MVNNEWISAFNEMVYEKGDGNMSELSMNDMERILDGCICGNPHSIRVGFKRLTDSAVIPTKAHASDSGFDLVASEDIIIEPGETAVVPTGIAVELPAGYEAQVRPRSGVTAKTKLRVQLGTIDNGYSGEIGVIVDNIFADIHAGTGLATRIIDGKVVIGDEVVAVGSYQIYKGDRIAQLVVQPLPAVVAVEVFDERYSERGTGGFGSTGVREISEVCGNCDGSMFANYRINNDGEKEFGHSCYCGNEKWEADL